MDDQNMSHNLAREWVAGVLRAERLKGNLTMPGDEGPTLASKWVRYSVAWPQTAGEYNEPAETERPHLVEVYVTVPGNLKEDEVERLVARLRVAADADFHFGERFRAAHMADFDVTKDRKRVGSLELGADAQRLTLQFTVEGPRASALKHVA